MPNLYSRNSINRSAGFSLIELIVVILIIGILMAIAIPNYTAHMRRAKLSDGTAKMQEIRVQYEQYFQDNGNYGTASCTDGLINLALYNDAYFTYGCALSGGGTGYTLTGTSQPGQGLGATVGDFTYTLIETNQRATTKYNGTAYTTKLCWLISGGEC